MFSANFVIMLFFVFGFSVTAYDKKKRKACKRHSRNLKADAGWQFYIDMVKNAQSVRIARNSSLDCRNAASGHRGSSLCPSCE